MSRKIALAAMAAVIFAAIVPGVVHSADQARATVGGFALRVSSLTSGQSAETGDVTTVMKRFGLPEGLDAGSPLTYGEIARIAASLGVAIAPEPNPSGPVSQDLSRAIAGLLSAAYAGHGAPATDEPPAQCLTSDNRGTCVDCCKAATNSTGQYCGRFCHANVTPPPSPGEPQP
jgi:hypothetical protein